MSELYGMGAPYMFNTMNAQNAAFSPSTVHIQNTKLATYFRRYLLQRAMSVFKWKLPETWNRDYFLYTLYCMGYIAIVNTDKFGVIPQSCGLQDYDVFYAPKNVLISNPLLRGILNPQIDKQCTLFKLMPDYGGILDIVNYHVDLLCLGSETAAINLLNSKFSYVFGAANDAAAKSFYKLYDDIASGKPAVAVDKSLMNKDGSPSWQGFTQNVGQNYIVSDILSDMRKIENMFNTAIGIPNANTDKKERLITNEVEANNTETSSLCELWIEQLQQTCEKSNKMFGLELSVDWRVKPQTQTAEKPNKEGGKE